MPKRTQLFQLFPWSGGIVTAIDEALLQSGQLTDYTNGIFDTQGSKKKREGINFDYDDYTFTVATRSSSTTTRTLRGWKVGAVFATGDSVTVASAGASSYNGTSLAVTAVTDIDFTEASAAGLVTEGTDKINKTAHGLNDGWPVYYTAAGTAIGGLTSGTIYYVVASTPNDFSLALTVGGGAINLTSDGVGNHRFRSYGVSYTAVASVSETATAETTARLTGANKIVAGHDFWFGASAKTQRLVTIDERGKLVSYASGARTRINDTGTAYTLPITQASFLTFNNKLLVATDISGNKLKSWAGSGNLADIAGAPECSILREHQGRVFCNDKTNLDRLHFSETADETVWLGLGDSGAIDIGVGDGDPSGIVAIFPTFKGDLFVAKRTKLYRVRGTAPENWIVELVSDGIGCVSHNAIAAVDQADMVFVSEKGVHSLQATDAYGSFESSYISKDIQTTISRDWSRSRFKYIQAAYAPEINSVAFAVSEDSTTNNVIYFYNTEIKGWYKWSGFNCEAMVAATDADRKRLYIGGATGRLAQTFAGTRYDTSETGAQVAIVFRVATGLIFPDQNPSTVKGFKKFSLIYKPVGSHTITASIRIDNFSAQSIAFSENSGDDLLGVSFVLGVSSLGATSTLAPYTQSLDGYGRGAKLTLTQGGINEEIEIQGFSYEYEAAADQQETRLGDAS
jgi:hypothetical protein